ncbi:hypothetical protein [Elizabethkingia anophelis]|uniref:Uncharacterized protein n=1 Tax=Elizabethkingia anophelis TaxID=1117645 RepID=A0A494J993_9FLAO|nr:hypothetical protein [Elizabethkingia anophelis]AQX51625.1 hypothetical protein AYC66_13500 [Elizabethkingia anophelis]MCT4196358.1 hypothetical protein [Elizabethkingia anophelis]MCT4225697.1 hypothetical protein [Elizabethkingia anophelis]MCT4307288.1 hypothetical protein [Elizabethkingia anophelis]MDV2473043.1 hypothetical protein [Elizabethkingia anophelis]
MNIQKRTKNNKDKADTYRTAQPKAYGIMAGQKGGFAGLLCYPATLRDLFRFLLVFALVRLDCMAFFFSVFSFGNNFNRK